jgi:hypothetical protein
MYTTRPMHWIESNLPILQALSGLMAACMTLVLIALTCVYARANWKTMRLMEADIRFRTEPIPKITLRLAHKASAMETSLAQQKTVKVCITTSNAPLVIKDLQLSVSFRSGAHKDFHLPVAGMIRLPIGDEYDLDTEIVAAESVDHWSVNLDYWDLTGKIEYRTWFGPGGATFSYGPKGSTTIRKALLYRWHRFRGREPVIVGHGEVRTTARHN